MRNVKVYKGETVREAVFLQFGIDCEELQGGVGHYTAAICEWPDGRIESIPVNMVRFITPRNNESEYGWQPIETAPKDRKNVVCEGDRTAIELVVWNDETNWWQDETNRVVDATEWYRFEEETK